MRAAEIHRNYKNNPLVALVLDGGGMRGILTCLALREI
jgi:hypothetical protein